MLSCLYPHSQFARKKHSPRISFMTHKLKSRSVIIVNVMRVRTRRIRSRSENPNAVNCEQPRHFCQSYYRFTRFRGGSPSSCWSRQRSGGPQME
jgi:hypothetical protein